MTKIAVLIGSTRQGRQSDKLAKWVAADLRAKNADVEVLDLRDYSMPFFDEAISPRYNPGRKADPQTKKWLDKMSEFEGYVFITPEYNRSMPAVLKNAIDVLDYQMEDKPVAIVAHGSTGGAQAVASLRMALPGVGAVTLPQALYFSDRVGETMSDDGELSEELRSRQHGPQSMLDSQMDTLLRYAEALKNISNKK